MSKPVYKPLPEPERSIFRVVTKTGLVLGILFIIFGVAVAPLTGGIKYSRQSSALQTAHALGLSMYCYAQDNGGKYPDGKSSTEVFQKLMDGGYVTDPTIFYLRLAGKTKAVPGQKLKPENVCWDVTASVDANTPGEIPLIFMTGYKVNYVPDGTAVLLIKPYPLYGNRSWLDWWQEEPAPWPAKTGVAVFYKNNSAAFRPWDATVKPDAAIPHFISPDFKPDGKTYRQLTPDGALPQ